MMERCKKSLHHVSKCKKMCNRCSKMFQDVRKTPVKESLCPGSPAPKVWNKRGTDRNHSSLMRLSRGFSRA